jgi:Rieske 2Fe-2S family protein
MIASPESPADRMRHQLAHRPEGHALPGDFYRDQGFYDLDLELLFYREWILAGHDCELQKPGDFFTMQIGAYPLIVTRDASGKIRAHHNTCRHRGFKVCDAPRGSVRRFVCPYHQWTYDPDGRLIRARAMEQPDFDATRYGLKPAHAESVGGYIFVSVAETPPDFAPVREMVAPYFAPFDLASAKIAHESTIIEEGNWKLVLENNRECYHCAGSHPELCRTFPEAPSFMRTTNNQGEGIIDQFWKAREAEGLPSRFQIADSGQYRLSRIPLMDDARSYTMSGKPAVGKLMGRVPHDNLGTLMFFHFPSSWNHFLGDMVISFRVLPIGPKRTEVTTKWMVNKDAVEGVDYDLKTLTEVWVATNDQDRTLVERNQRGIDSPAYEPGPYSTEYEDGVLQFIDWYTTTMTGRLTGGAGKLKSVA